MDKDEIGIEDRAEQLRLRRYFTNVSKVVSCGLNTERFWFGLHVIKTKNFATQYKRLGLPAKMFDGK